MHMPSIESVLKIALDPYLNLLDDWPSLVTSHLPINLTHLDMSQVETMRHRYWNHIQEAKKRLAAENPGVSKKDILTMAREEHDTQTERFIQWL